MSDLNTSNTITYELISLEHSWEDYSDLGIDIYNYRNELKRLRHDNGQETREESDARLQKLFQREEGLKTQHFDRIHNGYFDAFGNDIDKGAEKTKIPHAMFDDRIRDFEINWDSSTLKAHGKTFIGIEVRPSDLLLREISESKDQYSQTAAHIVSKPNPSKQGRPSRGEQIMKAILRHHNENKAWFDLPPTERRIQYFKFIKEVYQKCPKTSQGFSYKTIEKYEKIFKESL
ncbi:hypothetical protein [Hirschia litorea]|uniref:Uncharacterized protein n=1 Tax=Hirschia litorea TaxID=1199156 RepID=A0ABW2IJG4_9PROT